MSSDSHCILVDDFSESPRADSFINFLTFVDHILKVSLRLQDSKSFPQVNRPLQMHISDAIMNLQTVFSQLEQQVSYQ